MVTSAMSGSIRPSSRRKNAQFKQRKLLWGDLSPQLPWNREVKEVGLDAPVAGEGAVAYDKIGAARAALWAVRGKRWVGDLQYLDSAKHVAANAGWQTV